MAAGRGVQALKKAPLTGRPPQLTAAQLGRVERELLKGARANGYSTELWTLQRVGEVIARVTEVSYHPGHVWKVLRKLDWTRQRPARRAAERDEEAIDTWVRERWPELKKARRDQVWIVFEDESGFSLTPCVRTTWAPRGKTPVLIHRQRSWTPISAAAFTC